MPTYVVDGTHGAGKIPLMPNYLISASENAVVLRNYEGMIFRYAPEDRAQAGEHYPSLGVSNLLSGNRDMLIPEGTPRMVRRQEHAAEAAADDKPVDVIQLEGYQHATTLDPRPTWNRSKAK